jgi:hypothetical protein
MGIRELPERTGAARANEGRPGRTPTHVSPVDLVTTDVRKQRRESIFGTGLRARDAGGVEKLSWVSGAIFGIWSAP